MAPDDPEVPVSVTIRFRRPDGDVVDVRINVPEGDVREVLAELRAEFYADQVYADSRAAQAVAGGIAWREAVVESETWDKAVRAIDERLAEPIAPLLSAPQLRTDDDGRHWDDAGREWWAVDVDGELTYQRIEAQGQMCGATEWATCDDGRPHVYRVCSRTPHEDRWHRETRDGKVWAESSGDDGPIPSGPWCEHTEKPAPSTERPITDESHDSGGSARDAPMP